MNYLIEFRLRGFDMTHCVGPHFELYPKGE